MRKKLQNGIGKRKSRGLFGYNFINVIGHGGERSCDKAIKCYKASDTEIVKLTLMKFTV